jgi:hypothetical protein
MTKQASGRKPSRKDVRAFDRWWETQTDHYLFRPAVEAYAKAHGWDPDDLYAATAPAPPLGWEGVEVLG